MSFKYTHRPGGSAACPQCKEAISRLANVCPHCRSDLTTDEQWMNQKEQTSAGCSMVLIIGLVALGVIGVSVLQIVG